MEYLTIAESLFVKTIICPSSPQQLSLITVTELIIGLGVTAIIREESDMQKLSFTITT